MCPSGWGLDAGRFSPDASFRLVFTRVNRPSRDEPGLLDPVETQSDLFGEGGSAGAEGHLVFRQA